MTQETMMEIVNKVGREHIYQELSNCAYSLANYLFLRTASELFDVPEVQKASQTLIIDAAAEMNVLIDILANTCMTPAERYEMVCAEEYKSNVLVNEILGGDDK